MEPRVACETGRAATKAHTKRENANEIVKELLKKYENRHGNPPLGKTFQECYDVKRKKPTQEYVDLYRKIKEELRELGVSYEY